MTACLAPCFPSCSSSEEIGLADSDKRHEVCDRTERSATILLAKRCPFWGLHCLRCGILFDWISGPAGSPGIVPRRYIPDDDLLARVANSPLRLFALCVCANGPLRPRFGIESDHTRKPRHRSDS